MELDPKDYDIVKLLTKIKNANGVYPPELLTPRRQTYLRRVAEIGLGFGVVTGLKTTLKNGDEARTFSSTASGLIEIALLLAIVTEAGAAAYIYRDQISELIESFSAQPKVEEVTSVPESIFSTELPELVLTELTQATPTPETNGTPSPSGTIVASAAAINTQNNQGDQNNPGTQSNSTPDPNGNNGNHFGQTPKPDRTSEPGNNDNINDNNRINNGNDK